MSNRRAYDPAEFAFAYGVPLATVWRLIRLGEIKAINIGAGNRPIYRITAAECERFERAHAAA